MKNGVGEAQPHQLDGAGASDDEIDKISRENGARLFAWDPFAHISREKATVGALRAKARDVDVSIRSRAEWRALCTAKWSARAAPWTQTGVTASPHRRLPDAALRLGRVGIDRASRSAESGSSRGTGHWPAGHRGASCA